MGKQKVEGEQCVQGGVISIDSVIAVRFTTGELISAANLGIKL